MKDVFRNVMVVMVGFVVTLVINGAGFCADESLVVTETGKVGIGTLNPNNRLTVYNQGLDLITLGIGGVYPSIAESGTNYYKQMEIDEPRYNIPIGVEDNGYRIGMAIQGYVNTDDFKGKLKNQISAWIRTGANTDEPTGTIEESIGILIENLQSANTTINNSYAIYQTSASARNYFSGPVGIGITHPGSYKLYVNGDLYAKRIKTSILPNDWQDIVFEDSYNLRSLFEVEEFIKKNKHLPEIPSAEELSETGLDTSEMLSIHMKKIEELTLYAIELKKENEELKDRLDRIEAKLGM